MVSNSLCIKFDTRCHSLFYSFNELLLIDNFDLLAAANINCFFIVYTLFYLFFSKYFLVKIKSENT